MSLAQVEIYDFQFHKLVCYEISIFIVFLRISTISCNISTEVGGQVTHKEGVTMPFNLHPQEKYMTLFLFLHGSKIEICIYFYVSTFFLCHLCFLYTIHFSVILFSKSLFLISFTRNLLLYEKYEIDNSS